MGAPKNTAARIIGNRYLKQLHEMLKPILIAAGVRSVEEQIGRPQRFYQRARERDRLRVSDYLATCAVLDQDPGELLSMALSESPQADTRPPRIVAQAKKLLTTTPARRKKPAGIGAERLASLDRLFNSDPAQTRRSIKKSLSQAAPQEVPQLLGIYCH